MSLQLLHGLTIERGKNGSDTDRPIGTDGEGNNSFTPESF